MRFDLFRYAPAWYKLFVTAFVVLSSLLLSYIIALLLAAPFFNIDFKVITGYIASGVNENNIQLIKFLQFFQTIGTFLIPSLILAALFSESPSKFLMTAKKPMPFTVLLVVFLVITAVPLINFTGYLNSELRFPEFLSGLENKIVELEQEAQKLTEHLLKSDKFPDLLVNLTIVAVLPAISEEFLFRGVLQRLFSELTKNVHRGIIITAILFSFFHLQFYGFLPRLLLGLLFGYLLIWTKTIWIPVLAHFVNNATAVIVYYFSSRPAEQTTLDELGKRNGDMIFLLMSFFIVSGLISLIYYYEKTNKPVSKE